MQKSQKKLQEALGVQLWGLNFQLKCVDCTYSFEYVQELQTYLHENKKYDPVFAIKLPPLLSHP